MSDEQVYTASWYVKDGKVVGVPPAIRPVDDIGNKQMTTKDKEKLHQIAQQIADRACMDINHQANLPSTPQVKYKAQALLENVIKILQERV